jgi:hypothetical protein
MPVATLRAKYAALRSVFTERSRRLWAATEARALGHGGIAAVARATGLSTATVRRGLAELDATVPLPGDRVRKADEVMSLEQRMKRAHLAMLVEVKNQLTAEQQQQLRALQGPERDRRRRFLPKNE